MMFGFGDDAVPRDDAVDLMDALVCEFLIGTVRTFVLAREGGGAKIVYVCPVHVTCCVWGHAQAAAACQKARDRHVPLTFGAFEVRTWRPARVLAIMLAKAVIAGDARMVRRVADLMNKNAEIKAARSAVAGGGDGGAGPS